MAFLDEDAIHLPNRQAYGMCQLFATDEKEGHITSTKHYGAMW